jgi:hypothetical protein
MEFIKRHSDAVGFTLMLCLLATAYLVRAKQSSTDDPAIWRADKQYYQDQGYFPLAVGEIVGEEGVFIRDEYQGMAVHIQTPGAAEGRTLMLMVSERARVYPREYLCTQSCPTLSTDGFVYWSEYMSPAHKAQCKDVRTTAREQYCDSYKKGKRYTFWGTMEQKEGDTSQHILGTVNIVVEE